MIAALAAPAHWRCIEFISDLHLQAGLPATFSAWRDYLKSTGADALFILGDLFEVWIGDDVLGAGGDGTSDAFEAECVALLRQASRRIPVYVMHGNRDFLLGPSFAQASGTELLSDPCRLQAGGQQWLLSHGDALCLADTAYMNFRTEVRSTGWQQNFLSQPLEHRVATARALRQQSEERKRSSTDFVDLDRTQTMAWLNDAKAHTLIHGHTHQGIDHRLSEGLGRVVLSDWDADIHPPRAEVLQMLLEPGGQPQARLERVPLFTAS